MLPNDRRQGNPTRRKAPRRRDRAADVRRSIADAQSGDSAKQSMLGGPRSTHARSSLASTLGVQINRTRWPICRAVSTTWLRFAKTIMPGGNLLLLDESTTDVEVDMLRAAMSASRRGRRAPNP
jgi:hypothetical protein